jgi:hypothetical protein
MTSPKREVFRNGTLFLNFTRPFSPPKAGNYSKMDKARHASSRLIIPGSRIGRGFHAGIAVISSINLTASAKAFRSKFASASADCIFSAAARGIRIDGDVRKPLRFFFFGARKYVRLTTASPSAL